jgi:hypothetical protein
MACRKPKTALAMDQVWQRLMAYAREDKANEKSIAAAFNTMLDDLLDEDFFGTEGQCDPRGDHRD